MRRLVTILWVVIAIAVVVLGYVRLAPSDPQRWHVPPQVTADADLPGGAKRRVAAGPDGLERLDRIARDWPRTRVLAGSVEQGMVTYVTRSRVFGFPDYTTVQQVGDELEIFARLRFGGSDLGVNEARVEEWIDALQAGG